MRRNSVLLVLAGAALLTLVAVMGDWEFLRQKPSEVAAEPEVQPAATSEASIPFSPAEDVVKRRAEEFPAETGIWALIQDALDRAAISGVLVYTLDYTKLPELLRMQTMSHLNDNVVAFIKQHGQSFISDERGMARLPRYGPKQLIYAERDGKSDLQQRGRMNKAWLELRRHPRLEVLVVDAENKPVSNFPVAMQRRSANQAVSKEMAWTNGFGIAAFAPPPPSDLEINYQGSLCFTVAVDGLSLHDFPNAWHRLTDADLEVGRITLSKPPIGTLQVEVIDPNPDGLRRGSGSYVRVEIEAPSKPELYGSNFNELKSIRTDSGIVKFVGLGASVIASYKNGEERFEGPKTEDEHVHHVVTLHQENIWTGTLIGLDGKPAGAGLLRFVDQAIGEEEIDSNDNFLRTDQDGSFRISVFPSFVSDKNARRAAGLIFEAQEDGSILWAQMELGAAPEVDLGSIQLQKLPVVLTGTITDEHGLAVPDVDLSEHSFAESSNEPGSILSLAAEVVEISEAEEFKIWLSGPLDAEYRLGAQADGYSNQRDIPAKVGVPVKIILRKEPLENGRITGSVRIEPWATSSDFRFLYYREAKAFYRTHLPTRSAQDGSETFYLDTDSNEKIVILIETLVGEILYQSEPIPVVAGQTHGLGQVGSAEGLLPQVSWTVQDENGLPLRAEFEVTTDSHSGSAYSYQGKCTVRTINPMRTVRVSAEGFLTKELEQPNTSQTIVLQRIRD